MKYLKLVAIPFVLYFLGYILGPTIAPLLVSEKNASGALVRKVDYKGAQYSIDLATYASQELPATLRMTKAAKISTSDGAGEVRLVVGEEVTLLERQGDRLLIEKPESLGRGTVGLDDTDLFVILAERKFLAAAGQVVPAKQEESKEVVVAVQEEPEAQPVAQPVMREDDPEPLVVVEPVPDPEPVVEPDPEPAPVAGGGKLSDEQIVALMQENIAGGSLKEFTVAQVKGWKANGEETIDGTTYQIGLAAYEAQTIFGVRDVQAKALIQDGKIVRWVYANSGMEIQ